MSEISKIIADGARRIGKSLGEDAGQAVKKLYHQTGDNLDRVVKNHVENDAEHAGRLRDLGRHGHDEPAAPHTGSGGSGGGGGGKPKGSGPGSSGPGNSHSEKFKDPEGPKLGSAKPGGGQHTEGNGRCQTGGDPVDVISGQMITSAVDLDLAAALPLILRRAYASGYRTGTVFGPGWSSTLGQRVEVDQSGIHFAGDDGQVLHYPYPRAHGVRVYPQDGARWPLVWERSDSSDVIRIEDPDTGLTRHFPQPQSGTRGARPLSAVSDRNDSRIDFVRDAEGFPVEVRHSGGPVVAVDRVSTSGGWRVAGLRLLEPGEPAEAREPGEPGERPEPAQGAASTDDAQAPGVEVVRFGYDARGRLKQVVNSSGLPLVYEHDEQDRITGWTDRNGHWYAYSYDVQGRVSEGRGPEGALDARFAYDPERRTTVVTDGRGHRIEYHYDEHQHLCRVVDQLGHAVETEHDRYGRLLSYTDPLGHTTRLTLDEYGEPVRVDRPDGTDLEIQYDDGHRPVAVRTPEGLTWRQSFDERGNRTRLTDRSGAVYLFEHDRTGSLTALTDPLGNTTTARYDARGLLLESVDPVGGRVRYEYDAFGRTVAEHDELGRTTRYAWSVEGKLLCATDSQGASEQWEYDPEGNLLRHTAPSGAVTAFEYSHFHLPTARIEPDGSRYTLEYDSELRLTRVTQPQGLTWEYSHDPVGRTVRERDFEGREVSYTYDAAGQLTERRNGAGQTVCYRYDPVGRVTEKSADGRTTEYTYDRAGRLQRARNEDSTLLRGYDAVGRLLRETVDGRSIDYAFDAAGRLTRRQTPSGAVSRWTYDEAGRPESLTSAGHRITFAHDEAGRETTRGLAPRLSLTFDWDSGDRLVAQSIMPGASGAAGQGGAVRQETGTGTGTGARLERTYSYGPDGHLASIVDRTPERPATTTAFHADRLGRVTSVQGPGPDWTEAYTYDPAGHLLDASWSGTRGSAAQGPRDYDGSLLRSAGRVGYERDAQGRVVTRRERTLSGKQRTWSYTWDAEDRLTDLRTPQGAHWRYRYDPLGRRISKQRLEEGAGEERGLERTDFTWDGISLAEQTSHAPGLPGPYTLSWDHRGLHPVAQNEQVVREGATPVTGGGDDTDRRFFAIVTDLVGTPTRLLTEDGATAWEQRSTLWGVPVDTGRHATDTPLRFPGQYYDSESRLHYNVYRYYDPAAGRYLTPDPLGLEPAPDAHGYVDNPLQACDPLGLAPTWQPLNGGLPGTGVINFNPPAAAPAGGTPPRHDRSSEYPSGYWKGTHEQMARKWTTEGLNNKVDYNKIDDSTYRNSLTWFDKTGTKIPQGELTYEHTQAVVDHWNSTGYNSDRSTRNTFYNNASKMEPMTRSLNSSGGGKMQATYRQDVGANYSCT